MGNGFYNFSNEFGSFSIECGVYSYIETITNKEMRKRVVKVVGSGKGYFTVVENGFHTNIKKDEISKCSKY